MREPLNVAGQRETEREREEGVEKKQIDSSAAPSSRPVLS